MNELKAIEILNDYIELISKYAVRLKNGGVVEIPSEEDCEAFRLAITALQERIAQKTVKHAFNKASIKLNIKIKFVEDNNEQFELW